MKKRNIMKSGILVILCLLAFISFNLFLLSGCLFPPPYEEVLDDNNTDYEKEEDKDNNRFPNNLIPKCTKRRLHKSTLLNIQRLLDSKKFLTAEKLLRDLHLKTDLIEEKILAQDLYNYVSALIALESGNYLACLKELNKISKDRRTEIIKALQREGLIIPDSVK